MPTGLGRPPSADVGPGERVNNCRPSFEQVGGRVSSSLEAAVSGSELISLAQLKLVALFFHPHPREWENFQNCSG